jgi:hypothetical protein
MSPKNANEHRIVNTALRGSCINRRLNVLLKKENNRYCDTSLTSCKWHLNITIVIGLLLELSKAVRYEATIDLKLMMLVVVRE